MQHWFLHALLFLPKFLGATQQGNRNLETHIPNFEKSSDLKNFRRNNATLIFTRPFFSTIISGCDATGQQESWNAYTKFWKVFRPKKLPTQQCNTDFHTPFLFLPKFLGSTQQGNRNLETHVPNFGKSSDPNYFRCNNATLIFTRPFSHT